MKKDFFFSFSLKHDTLKVSKCNSIRSVTILDRSFGKSIMPFILFSPVLSAFSWSIGFSLSFIMLVKNRKKTCSEARAPLRNATRAKSER